MRYKQRGKGKVVDLNRRRTEKFGEAKRQLDRLKQVFGDGQLNWLTVNHITNGAIYNGELEKKIDNLLDTIHSLIDSEDYADIIKIIERENLIKILDSDTFYSFQIAILAENIKGNLTRSILFDKFFEHDSKVEIFWRPFVDELNKLTEDSSASELIFESAFEQYVSKFDRGTVSYNRARYELGMDVTVNVYGRGRGLQVVEAAEGNTFYTTEDGTIYVPPYVAIFKDRKMNLMNWRISILHEIGHHIHNTFVVNVNPNTLRYEYSPIH